jgi:hypothetical protein
MAAPVFKLNVAERESLGGFKRHLEAEVARLREKNDAVDMDPVRTAALRGEIRALNNLLRLFDDPKNIRPVTE